MVILLSSMERKQYDSDTEIIEMTENSNLWSAVRREFAESICLNGNDLEERKPKKRKMRKPHFIDKEIIAMINAVSDRKEILICSNRKSGDQGSSSSSKRNNVCRDNAWRQVTNYVNCVGVCKRDMKEVRKKFHDFRSYVNMKRKSVKTPGTDGGPGIPETYSVAEKAMLSFINGLEGIPDSESNASSEMMVLVGDEPVCNFNPSSLKETATITSSDTSSSQIIERELSTTEDPLEQKVNDYTSIKCVGKTKNRDTEMPGLKNNTNPQSDNLYKQGRKRALTSSDDFIKRAVIDYITKKTVEKPENPDLDFLKSILPDMAALNTSQKIRFKQKLLQLLDDVCNEGTS